MTRKIEQVLIQAGRGHILWQVQGWPARVQEQFLAACRCGVDTFPGWSVMPLGLRLQRTGLGAVTEEKRQESSLLGRQGGPSRGVKGPNSHSPLPRPEEARGPGKHGRRWGTHSSINKGKGGGGLVTACQDSDHRGRAEAGAGQACCANTNLAPWVWCFPYIYAIWPSSI